VLFGEVEPGEFTEELDGLERTHENTRGHVLIINYSQFVVTPTSSATVLVDDILTRPAIHNVIKGARIFNS